MMPSLGARPPKINTSAKALSQHAERVGYFDCLGIRFHSRLTWVKQSEKDATLLRQAADAVLRCKAGLGGQPITSILHGYKMKAVAAALYGTELWGYLTVKSLERVENNFLRVFSG